MNIIIPKGAKNENEKITGIPICISGSFETGVELIQNGTFDGGFGGIFSNWQITTTEGKTFNFDNDKINFANPPDVGFASASQTLSIEKGKEYKLSLNVETGYATINIFDAVTNTLILTNSTNSTGVSEFFFVPLFDNIKVVITQPSYTPPLIFDDVSLKSKGDSSQGSLIQVFDVNNEEILSKRKFYQKGLIITEPTIWKEGACEDFAVVRELKINNTDIINAINTNGTNIVNAINENALIEFDVEKDIEPNTDAEFEITPLGSEIRDYQIFEISTMQDITSDVSTLIQGTNKVRIFTELPLSIKITGTRTQI